MKETIPVNRVERKRSIKGYFLLLPDYVLYLLMKRPVTWPTSKGRTVWSQVGDRRPTKQSTPRRRSTSSLSIFQQYFDVQWHGRDQWSETLLFDLTIEFYRTGGDPRFYNLYIRVHMCLYLFSVSNEWIRSLWWLCICWFSKKVHYKGRNVCKWIYNDVTVVFSVMIVKIKGIVNRFLQRRNDLLSKRTCLYSGTDYETIL